MDSKEKNCIICGNQTKVMARIKLNSGFYLCDECLKKVGLSQGYTKTVLKAATKYDIQDRITYVETSNKINRERQSAFQTTTSIKNYIWFDDMHMWFAQPTGIFKKKIDDSFIFTYSEILKYQLNEDNGAVASGGLGKAIVGGAFFGVAGTIAGGTSKKIDNVCNSLQIIITTTNIDNPVVIIDLIKSETKKSSIVYKEAVREAHEILRKLELITNQFQKQTQEQLPTVADNNISVADEIKKFKELLDIGAITEDEYNSKKTELLNL